MLDRELIRRVRRIQMVTKRLVNPQLLGQYHSVFKGRGMDFDEVKTYVEGDDVRFIDWNVSARSEDLYVKHFQEERELTVQIVVDASSSMSFGSQKQLKRSVAAQVAAVFSMLAINNNDRVGLVIFDEEVDKYIPPRKGRKHIMRLITEILTHKPRHRETSLASALDYVTRISRRRSIVFVISDFVDPGWEQALKLASRRHDLVPVVISDPLEENLNTLQASADKARNWPWWKRVLLGGLWHVEDSENGLETYFDAGSSTQVRGLSHQHQAWRARTFQVFRKLGLDVLEFRTDFNDDRDFVHPIAVFFKRRARRR